MGWNLSGARAISEDGQTIVGVDTTTSRAWVATIPQPGSTMVLVSSSSRASHPFKLGERVSYSFTPANPESVPILFIQRIAEIAQCMKTQGESITSDSSPVEINQEKMS